MYLALILLVVAGGLLGWRWYYGGFPWQRANTPAATSPAQTGTAPPNNAANAPSAPNSQTLTPQAASPATAPNRVNTQNLPATNSATPLAADPGEKNSANPSPDASSSEASSSPDSAAAATGGTADDTEASQSTQVQKPKQTAPAVEAKKTAPARPATARTAKRPASRASISDEDSSASEGEALLTQGERYLYGNGVAQNCGRAQNSLEAAADHGNSRALSDLATMYSTGHCVRRDLPTSYRWFVKALHQQPANARISTDLQVLWNQMTPEEKQAAMR
jgi:TPR repeat protein